MQNHSGNLNQWLIQRGFLSTYEVEGVKSLSKIVDASICCGIYFLHFANDQYYVGLAKNVIKRYSQHRQIHTDIVRISFKQIPLDSLKQEESLDIEFFKSRVRLRNIDEMEDLIMRRKFDELVEDSFTDQFLSNIHYNDWNGNKYVNDELQTNYKYREAHKLLSDQSYFPDFIKALKFYVQSCIPAPVKTEYSFWSITCFKPKNNSEHIVARLNIYQQEVFTVYFNRNHHGELRLDYKFHLAETPLLDENGRQSIKNTIKRQYPSVEFHDFKYRTGGKDQIRVWVSRQDIKHLFQLPEFIKAIRLHNLRLMRKGTNMNRVSHCMDLAQEALRF